MKISKMRLRAAMAVGLFHLQGTRGITQDNMALKGPIITRCDQLPSQGFLNGELVIGDDIDCTGHLMRWIVITSPSVIKSVDGKPFIMTNVVWVTIPGVHATFLARGVTLTRTKNAERMSFFLLNSGGTVDFKVDAWHSPPAEATQEDHHGLVLQYQDGVVLNALYTSESIIAVAKSPTDPRPAEQEIHDTVFQQLLAGAAESSDIPSHLEASTQRSEGGPGRFTSSNPSQPTTLPSREGGDEKVTDNKDGSTVAADIDSTIDALADDAYTRGTAAEDGNIDKNKVFADGSSHLDYTSGPAKGSNTYDPADKSATATVSANPSATEGTAAAFAGVDHDKTAGFSTLPGDKSTAPDTPFAYAAVGISRGRFQDLVRSKRSKVFGDKVDGSIALENDKPAFLHESLTDSIISNHFKELRALIILEKIGQDAEKERLARKRKGQEDAKVTTTMVDGFPSAEAASFDEGHGSRQGHTLGR